MRPVRLDLIAFLEAGLVAEDDDADGVFLKVEGHAHNAVRELDQLARHHPGEAEDPSDAVVDLDDRTDVDGGHRLAKALDLGLYDRADLVGSYCHLTLLVRSESAPRIGLKRLLGLPLQICLARR